MQPVSAAQGGRKEGPLKAAGSAWWSGSEGTREGAT